MFSTDCKQSAPMNSESSEHDHLFISEDKIVILKVENAISKVLVSFAGYKYPISQHRVFISRVENAIAADEIFISKVINAIAAD